MKTVRMSRRDLVTKVSRKELYLNENWGGFSDAGVSYKGGLQSQGYAVDRVYTGPLTAFYRRLRVYWGHDGILYPVGQTDLDGEVIIHLDDRNPRILGVEVTP